MGLNRQEKADMIKEISEIIAGTEGLVIAEYRGLTVDAATKLRKEARENGVQSVSYTHLTLPTNSLV